MLVRIRQISCKHKDKSALENKTSWEKNQFKQDRVLWEGFPTSNKLDNYESWCDDGQYRRWLPWGSLALGCVRPYWFSRSNSMMISFSRSSGCSSRPISDATAGWTDLVTSGVTFTNMMIDDKWLHTKWSCTYCNVHQALYIYVFILGIGFRFKHYI